MAEVVIVPDASTGGTLVADEIVRLIDRRPDAVLGLATGSSPLPVYRALVSRMPSVDVSRVRAFALDEYVGLDPDDLAELPQCDPTRGRRTARARRGAGARALNGSLAGIEHAGEANQAELEASGGVDLQLLGIGTDGHIGFNEPGSSFASRTRVKTLTRRTRDDNARFSPRSMTFRCTASRRA